MTRANQVQSTSTYSTWNNVRYMLQSIWRYDRLLLLIIVLPMVAQLGTSVVAVIAPKLIIDQLTSGARVESMIWLGVGIAVALMILSLIDRLSDTQMDARSMSHRIHVALPSVRKRMTTDYENIVSQAGSTRWQKMMEAIQTNQSGTEAIVRQIGSLIKNSVGVIIFGGILLMLNPWIVLMLSIGAAINILASHKAIRYQRQHRDDWAAIDSKLLYLREQAVDGQGAKDIRIYSMAGWIMRLFTDANNERYQWHKKVAIQHYLFNHVVDSAIVFIRDLVAYGYLIYRVLNGLSVGEFVLYFGAIAGFSLWLGGMVNDIGQVQQSAIHVDEVRRYLDVPEHTRRGEGVPLPSFQDSSCDIQLKDVSYQYPDDDREIIHKLNLSIKKGEKLAIVGVNGAGKTTLVKLICGLLRPQEGQISIDGHSMGKYNIEDYYSLFSVAFQDAFISAFSIAENVSMQPESNTHRDRVRDALAKAGLDEHISSLPEGMDTRIGNIFTDHGTELSGGERQKLILARALYKDAPILILDEPTAALDPIAESRLYEQYAQLSRNKTSIYISHRLASTRFCDRIIFMENGDIAEEGTHEQLMALNGRYAHMFDVQSHYYQTEVKS